MDARDETPLRRAVAPAAGIFEQRRDPRRRMLWSGTLQTVDGPYPCIVLDLSLGGARVSLHRAPRRGDPVSLVLGPLGAFRGELVWERDGAAGISFREAPQDVARLIGEYLPPVEAAPPVGTL